MRPCPRCGSPSPDEAALCPACGFVLSPAGLAQTFVGHQSPEAGAPGPAPSQAKPEHPLKGTMIGIAPLGPAGGPPAYAPPGYTPPPYAPPPYAPPAYAPPPQAPAPPPGGLKSTMLGMAPIIPQAPVGAPTPYQSPAQTLSMSGGMPGAAPAPAGAPPPAPLGSSKTILGVARPGIAPLNPGAPPPAPFLATPGGPSFSSLPPPPPALSNEPLGEELSVIPGHGKQRRIPLLAALAIVAAGALLAAAAVALFLYRARGAIQTKVALAANGHEELVLTCPGCDDGATVRHEATTAVFNGHRATLALARELNIGENKLSIVLERRRGKSETVELSVPVDFRVRGDTADLAKTPPAIRIIAQAVKGSAVVIDGKALPLGADGTATLAVDVSQALTGADASVRTLEHRVPYAVTPPGGVPEHGEAIVRIGITPLVLQAPGESIVIDSPTFVLAGRTARNGAVSVEGRPITVDTAGQFAQVMGVSAVGETTVVVRAVAPDQAPRLLPVRVRRVSSLGAEAERLRPQATTSYAAIASPTSAQHGLFVLFDGSVLEARAENFTTVFLMETKSGCTSPPCLLRVTWGNKGGFGPGDSVSVYGTLSGAVDGPRSGTRIPSIAASFVAKGRP